MPSASNKKQTGSLPGLLFLALMIIAIFTIEYLNNKGPEKLSASEAYSVIESTPSHDDPEQGAGYSGNRIELFGESWLDVDYNGCDTRNDILARDLENPFISSNCKVTEGTLHDPYTGNTIEFQSGVDTSSEVQIDHIVPLAWAWRNGLYEASQEVRLEFANDPVNLLAVDGPANMSKSDSGPADWMPYNTGYSCEYLVQFATVIHTYSDHGLGINNRDAEFMSSYLTNSCGAIWVDPAGIDLGVSLQDSLTTTFHTILTPSLWLNKLHPASIVVLIVGLLTIPGTLSQMLRLSKRR